QNEELVKLNAGLEELVKERTQALADTLGLLEKAHDDLKKQFVMAVRVFSNLIDLREGNMAGHSRRVADLARQIAAGMGLPDAEVQDIFFAGLLHDIGMIGVPDALLHKPLNQMSKEERVIVHGHPVKGQAALMALEQLHGAALLIRHHHERFDGRGYPDGLVGEEIPMGARILAVVNELDGLLVGTELGRKLSRANALEAMKKAVGKRYDPAVIAMLEKVLNEKQPRQSHGEVRLSSGALLPGMILARDLVTGDGVLLLAKDYILNERIIE